MTPGDVEDGTHEEKVPINSLDHDGEGNNQDGHLRDHDLGEPEVRDIVVKGPPRRKPGCFISRGLCVLVIMLIVICIAVAGAGVGYFLRCWRCSSNDYGEDLYAPVPKPKVAPGLPWSDIRLPRTLIPSDYTLALKVDLEQFVFQGFVVINVLCKEDTNYVIIHSNDLTVDDPRVEVRDLTNNLGVHIDRHVRVPINQFHVLQMARDLVAGHRYKITFGRFTGELKDDLRGIYRSSYKDQSGTTRYLAASQLQSVDARKVFPCFDEPDLKANFTVTITHKDQYTALSNMPLNDTTLQPSGWMEDTFETTPIMSTYLLAFVVADFRKRELIAESGLKIRIWAQPNSYDQTEYPLQFCNKAYRFFAEYFNTPEIVPKADHAAIPDFSAGAMENWGLVLYRETALLHDEGVSSISNKYWVSLVMAHEIAHTWFGNMATMEWWDDLWLNEGFANTVMYFAVDDIYPEWKVFNLQLVNNVYPVMTKDSLLTSHAISTPIQDPDDIPQFFDSISYDKGMAVLRLLRSFLGWDDFKRGLQNYVAKYKFKNARMTDLWKTFAETVDNRHDVGRIMDTWTRQMGFPVVTLRHTRPGEIQLQQTRFLLNPDDRFDASSSPYKYKWYIPFIYQVQGVTGSHTVWLEKGSATISVPTDSWVLGNVDYMGFFRTNYDETMWVKLIEQLNTNHTVFSAANRAGLISDAFNLARASKLSYEIALNLTSYLDQEEDFVPWQAFLNSIDFIKGMFSNSNSYGKLKRYISNLLGRQLRRVRDYRQGDLLERNLRRAILEAAVSVGVPAAKDQALSDFDSWKKYDIGVSADIAVVVYAVGIMEGNEEVWDYVWEQSRQTRVASEAEVMMNALAYTQEPWLLWRYARWSLDPSRIRMQDVRNLFRYIASTPLGRTVALNFVLTNWEEVNRRFGMDAFLLRDIIYATTSFINNNYDYEQLRRLYRVQPPAGVARKAAENSLALIRSNINWMKLNHDVISSWLDKYGDT